MDTPTTIGGTFAVNRMSELGTPYQTEDQSCMYKKSGTWNSGKSEFEARNSGGVFDWAVDQSMVQEDSHEDYMTARADSDVSSAYF